MKAMTASLNRSGTGRARPRPHGLLGVKVLVSSLALTATILGWVKLSMADQAAATKAAAKPEPRRAAPALATPTVAYELAPLPTLVPLVAEPSSPSGSAAAPAAPSSAVAVQAAPTAVAPDPSQLRVVAVPQTPAPVAVTRSSR
jgi:hypothetical protein